MDWVHPNLAGDEKLVRTRQKLIEAAGGTEHVQSVIEVAPAVASALIVPSVQAAQNDDACLGSGPSARSRKTLTHSLLLQLRRM